AGELARELGDDYGVAKVEGNLGSIALLAGDNVEAIRRYDVVMAYMRATGNLRGVALYTQLHGIAYSYTGDHARGRALVEQSIATGREAGDPALLASTLRSLARMQAEEGDVDGAIPLLREALQLAVGLAERPGITEALQTVADVAQRQGDPRAGAVLFT